MYVCLFISLSLQACPLSFPPPPLLTPPYEFPPAPLAYEPFSTLAMIYEDEGDMEKSLQFGLIAAHLNPSDSEEWVKLADMSLEQGNVKQAIICYSKGSTP